LRYIVELILVLLCHYIFIGFRHAVDGCLELEPCGFCDGCAFADRDIISFVPIIHRDEFTM
jgi:hypothetical protein